MRDGLVGRGAGMLHRAPSRFLAPHQVLRITGAKPNANPASFCIIRRYRNDPFLHAADEQSDSHTIKTRVLYQVILLRWWIHRWKFI